MVSLDKRRIEEVIDAVTNSLHGDWLLVGGALVALWLEPRRITEDIDLIGLSGTADERLALMQLAERLGLPVEAVNSAADFFVSRIEGWRDELELFREGRSARIFRPTPTLFLLLKARRLSEHDLEDCLAAIRRARADGLRLAPDRVIALLDGLEPATEPRLAERRQALRAALGPA